MIRTIAILASKDLALLWRDRTALFWAFVFPVVVAVLFGTLFGGRMPEGNTLAIQVLDQDNTSLTKVLAASPALKVTRADSLAAGEAAVRAGKAVALVVIRPGGAVELRADPSRHAEIDILRGLIAAAAQPKPPVVAVAGSPDRPAAPFTLSFPAGMAWALIGCAAGFALLLTRERQAGTFLRLRAAPVSRLDILLGKAVACWLACVGELLLLLLLGAFLIGVRPADALGPPMALAAAAACFVGLMMLVSQFGQAEVTVAASAWGIMLLLALFGGAIMPFSMMPEWMQAIGQASPARWAIQIFEGALWRGQGWRELAWPCAVLAATGAGAFALGAVLFFRRVQ